MNLCDCATVKTNFRKPAILAKLLANLTNCICSNCSCKLIRGYQKKMQKLQKALRATRRNCMFVRFLAESIRIIAVAGKFITLLTPFDAVLSLKGFNTLE